MIRFLNVYYPTRTVLLVACEILVVSGCFVLATVGTLGFDNAILALNYEYGWLKIAFVTILSLMFSYYFDLYELQIVSTRQEVYFRILLTLGCGCFIISALIFFFPEIQISNGVNEKPVFAIGYFLLTPAMLLWRQLYAWTGSRDAFRERVYVLGDGELARSVVETIRSRPEIGMKVVDWHAMPGDQQDRKTYWIEELRGLGRSKQMVNRIIVALESPRGELPVEELLTLRFQGIRVEDVGTLRERLSGKIQLDGLRPSSFLYAEGFRLRKSEQFTRQVLSIAAAACGLLLFAPFFPLVVLFVRISSKGPIFFAQTRVGLNGKTFKVYKFRSMFVDAESAGARWATKNDPRVTKIGMFMRKTRIDEIPQLWNVLRGDMGFVGPRPERPEFMPQLVEAIPYFHLRHLVRPGLTGWAQVRYGYGSTIAETRNKLEYDLYYVKHMSLGLDLLIMFETVKTILRRRGAQ